MNLSFLYRDTQMNLAAEETEQLLHHWNLRKNTSWCVFSVVVCIFKSNYFLILLSVHKFYRSYVELSKILQQYPYVENYTVLYIISGEKLT